VAAHTVLDRSNTGMVGSNPSRGMGVCVCVFLCCVVRCGVQTLRRADPPLMESYQMSKRD
jgi:hypothetical protein